MLLTRCKCKVDDLGMFYRGVGDFGTLVFPVQDSNGFHLLQVLVCWQNVGGTQYSLSRCPRAAVMTGQTSCYCLSVPLPADDISLGMKSLHDLSFNIYIHLECAFVQHCDGPLFPNLQTHAIKNNAWMGDGRLIDCHSSYTHPAGDTTTAQTTIANGINPQKKHTGCCHLDSRL